MSEQQSFIVTARKWRPLKFEDVVGQSHITTTLKNAISSGRIHHAYLFTGPRGVGKTTCARILARALNCKNSVDSEPCNQCAACVDALEGRNVDVIEIDGASNNSVDDVRKLRENAKYAPMNGDYKMYIIDEVHMLSTAAFNALLKILEEPPRHLVFVFATTEIHKVPATILSRCQRFDFKRMETDDIVGQLRHISTIEHIAIDEESLMAIARKADGSMRDSQSIFDQVVSFCGTDIKYENLAQALHLIDTEFFFKLSEAARSHNINYMFEAARLVVQRGYDLQECLVGLLEHFRNILTVITTQSTDLIDASASILEKYKQEASLHSKADILRMMVLINQGEAVLRTNPPQPRVRFEFTLVQLASMDSTVDLAELLSRIGTHPTQPVGGTSMAVRLGKRPQVSNAPPAAIPPSVSKGLAPARVASTGTIRSMGSVSSLSSTNLSSRFHDVLNSLPAELEFIQRAFKQQVLEIDFTEVAMIMRPMSMLIASALEDKVPLLKAHIQATYKVNVAVQVIAPRIQQQQGYRPQPITTPQGGNTSQPPQMPTTGFGDVAASTQEATSPVMDLRPQAPQGTLPIEDTLIELFHARRALPA